VAGAVRPGWSVRQKSVYYPNGFAYLTAAPGDEWLPADASGESLRTASIATAPNRVVHPSSA